MRYLILLTVFILGCSKEPAPAISGSSNNNNQPQAITLGDNMNSGVVFYIDSTGSHGLIASAQDQDTAIAWSNGTDILIMTSVEMGMGSDNTQAIIYKQGVGKYAAKLSNNGWYLPSKNELLKMVQNQKYVKLDGIRKYWSSSENMAAYAWYQGINIQGNQKKSNKCAVRLISKF